MCQVSSGLKEVQIGPKGIKYNKVPLFVRKTGNITVANMSVQYTAIFHGYKNDYFQMKNCNIFLIFAQNIDCGYTLEPPQCSNEYPQSMF